MTEREYQKAMECFAPGPGLRARVQAAAERAEKPRARVRPLRTVLIAAAVCLALVGTAFAVTDAILHLDGLTRLVVTHRLDAAALEQYDEIVVLRDGAVWEQGRFPDLMERKGYFYSLYHVSNG